MGADSMTRILAQYIYDLKFEDLPTEVVARAKDRILDSLACAYSGYDLPCSRIAAETAEKGMGCCSVIGRRWKTSPTSAAFINGTIAHAVLQEDTGGGGHPSTVTVPAALAVAESLGSSGKDLILAVVLGYDIADRISLNESLTTMRKGFRGTLFHGFGAAAAAGKLMKLSVEQLQAALGFAANQAGGLAQVWWSGTMDAIFAAGMIARYGVHSAQLAGADATAAPEALEGPDGFYQAFFGRTDRLGYAIEALGKRYGIMQVIEKRYPACAACQCPIEAGKALRKAWADPRHIREVREITNAFFLTMAGSNTYPPYASPLAAQMSHQFCIASALLGRPVEDPLYYQECYQEPEVCTLARKVRMIDQGLSRPRLELELEDGRVYAEASRTDHPVIGYLPEIDRIKEKYRTHTQRFPGLERAQGILERILHLEQLKNTAELSISGVD